MKVDWQIEAIDRHPSQGLSQRDGRVILRVRQEDFKPLQAIFDDGAVSQLSQAGWMPGLTISGHAGDDVMVELSDVVPPVRAHEANPSFRRGAGLAFLSLYEELARLGLTIFDCNLESFLPDRFGRPRFFDLARIVPREARKFPYDSFCSQILAPLQLLERRPDLAELLCRPPSRLSPEQYMEIVAPRRAALLRRLEFGSTAMQSLHRALFGDPVSGLLHRGKFGPYALGLMEEYRSAGRKRNAPPNWTASLVTALRQHLNALRFDGMVLRKWQRYQSGHDLASLASAGDDWQRHVGSDLRTKTILDELRQLTPTTLVDIGANKGYFSYLAAHLGFDVTPIDHSATMMEAVSGTLAAGGHRLPMRSAVVDLSRIAPEDCWRFRSDVAMALSVTHHLRIAARMPWDRIAGLLSGLTGEVLLVEFKRGAKLSWPAPPSAALESDYRLENFTAALAKWFPSIRVNESYAAEANGRILIICRRKPPRDGSQE